MHTLSKTSAFVLYGALIFHHQADTKPPLLQRLYALCGSNAYETVVNKQFVMSPEGILTIKNCDGNISVKTEHKGNTVYLKAIKKSKKPEYLALIDIKERTEKQHDKTHISLSTQYTDKNISGAVDYILMVPASIKLQLSTNNGSISVKQVSGPISAKTNNGTIDLTETTAAIDAHAQKGSISIDHAHGPIRATTQAGTITINHAHSTSIIAHTDRGSLNTHCSFIPNNSRLLLSTLNGPIVLSLPETTNAHLCAHTAKGVLLSDMYITLNQQTLKLNRETWKQFKQTVNGNIGTGEADIKLSSQSGSIKIVEHKTM